MAKRIDYMASVDDAKTQEAQKVAQSSGIFRNWKVGNNILRLLPPVANTGWAKGHILLPVWQYWRLPPAENMARDIHRTFGPTYDDPIADVFAELRKLGVDTSKLEDKSQSAFYANVIDLKEDELRVQVQKFSKGLAHNILADLNNSDIVGKEVLNPYSGAALAVTYSPDEKDQKKIYKHTWPPRRVNQPIAQSDVEVEALMAQCQDLAEIFKPPEGEDLEQIIEIAKALYEFVAPVQQTGNGAPAAEQGEQDDLPF